MITIMIVERVKKDPNLRFITAVYPNYGNGGGEPSGILVSNDLYQSLWQNFKDYMSSHFISGQSAGACTFVSGLEVEDFIKEFKLWTDNEEKVIDLSGIKKT